MRQSKTASGQSRLRACWICCLAIFTSATCYAECLTPNYYKGQDYGASLFISIQPRDFILDQIVCLAQVLRQQHRDQKTFGILFFDSRKAAKYFLPPLEGSSRSSPEFARQLHALYSFDADKREESLSILPLGYYNPRWTTKVQIPIIGVLRCQLKVQNRCLIAGLGRITYPRESLRIKASGTIVLRGTIQRDGGIAAIKVVEADVTSGAEKARLTNAAVQDLKAWRFDAGSRSDAIRISYSYVIDTSLPHGGMPAVEWVDPDQVRIRGNPPQ